MTPAQLPLLVQTVANLASDADYRALVAQTGISRAHPDIWPCSDVLAKAFTALALMEAGVFDHTRLQNR